MSFLNNKTDSENIVSVDVVKKDPELMTKEKIVDAHDGVIEYFDGSVYRGGIKNSKRNGEGTLILLQENSYNLYLTPECLSVWNELKKINEYAIALCELSILLYYFYNYGFL
jgi:hypothetical protein